MSSSSKSSQPSGPMPLERFNTAAPEVAGELLDICAPIPSWRAGLLARRPYASQSELLAMARELSAQWSDLEVDAALAHHPRIGEKVAGEGAEARASRQEQGNLSEDERARLEWVEANQAYEQRFDRIFLIRAAGRTPEEMMSQLQQRMGNSPEEEARVRAGELAEIALLRLEHAIEGDGAR